MYPYKYMIPNNSKPLYRNTSNINSYSTTYPSTTTYTNTNDDRFFFAPFLVGGLAGTALGYGIANNNQLNNNQPCCGFFPYPQMMPMPYYPVYNNTTFYN